MLTFVIILIAVVLVLALIIMGIYNGLVSKRNKVMNSWSQIDIQLKRRFDLIPNLIETVKGYAAHERQTFDAVMQARSSYMDAGSGIAEPPWCPIRRGKQPKGVFQVP